jgi:hypothetical protein
MKTKQLLLSAALALTAYGASAQCHADLSYTVSGNMVSFTNLSTPSGPNDSVVWQFGDGIYSYLKSPTHIYNHSGTYTVHMSVNPIGCFDDTTFNITITTPACIDSFLISNADTLTGKLAFNIIGGAKPGSSYAWNFGDGSTQVSTADSVHHQYSQPGNYTIQMTVTNATCTAYYYRNILAGNVHMGYTYATSGNTVNTASTANFGSLSPNAFTWKEGSSYLGYGATATKTYPSTGWHTITHSCFYHQYTAIENHLVNTAPVSKSIWVGSNNLNVYANTPIIDSLLDTVRIWVISYDSAAQTLTAVDSATKVGPAGNVSHSFIGIPNGTYLVKAALISGPHMPAVMPTYDSSSLSWSGARNILLYNGVAHSQVMMLAGSNPGGPGFVGGSVLMGANKTAGPGDPVQGVSLFLQNASGQNIAYAVTGADGKYSFANIPLGIYKVVPEMLNYYGHAFNNVVINSGQQSNTAVNFKSEHNQITPEAATGVSNIQKTALLTVFPNPAKEQVLISGKGLGQGQLTINIFDATGKLVSSQQVQLENSSIHLPINTSRLAPGSYQLSIRGAQVYEMHQLIKL